MYKSKMLYLENKETFFSQRDCILIGGYAMVFLLFSLKLLPVNIAMSIAVTLFAISPLELLSSLYFFSLPWAYIGKFSFGLTISLLQSSIFLIRLIVEKQSMMLSRFELAVLFELLITASLALIKYSSLTGVSLVFYYLIACYLWHTYLLDNNKSSLFLQRSLFSVLISVAIAVIYGLIYRTGNNRWISGIGYSVQLYGTMGTSRLGYYLCISMLYPLYFVKNKLPKILICCFLTVGILATVSMTAFIMMIFLYVVYFLSQNGPSLRKIAIIGAVALGLLVVWIFANSISKISFIQPIYTRIQLTITSLENGDLNSATTGRESLLESGIRRFQDSSMMEKIWGGQSLKDDGAMNTHNSYIDMLNYTGILGAFFVSLLQVYRLLQYRKLAQKNILFLIKALTLLCACSTSVFFAQYWQILLYL